MKMLNKKKMYDELKRKIPMFNKCIQSLIMRSEKELKDLNIESKNTKKEINIFYKKFFECFNNIEEMLSFLFKDINQLYRKRIYQMNHFNGLFKKVLEDFDEKTILKRYVFLNLFLDYYESFALFLRPFLVKLWEKERNEKVRDDYTSSVLYQYLFPSFFRIEKFTSIFNYKLRNVIAHSNYLIESKDFSIEYYNRSIYSHHGEKIDVQIGRLYTKLYNLVIWFTTEFDIKINEIMMKSFDSSIEGYWSNYFTEYVESWREYHKKDWNASQST